MRMVRCFLNGYCDQLPSFFFVFDRQDRYQPNTGESTEKPLNVCAFPHLKNAKKELTEHTPCDSTTSHCTYQWQ